MTTGTKEYLSDICRIIDKTVDVEKIYLFGSHAYGTPTADSDYDLCVVIPDGTMRPADAVKKIRRALFPVQTAPLDVIVYHASVFQQRQAKPSIERKIGREGVLLHAHAIRRSDTLSVEFGTG
ncbi:MAG: nucleotidyltransferase domain-containing protein [Bacillota bacterium]|nr:nucleotidyltransferase domain-containing protein [Bacillota bacterium]